MATSQETRLKKAHVALLKHPETALYSGVILMGKSSVDDENFTAYTDGFYKRYSREFISKLSDEELRGIVMHENLHVALKHMQRFIREFKDNPHLTNVSADYVVNDMKSQENIRKNQSQHIDCYFETGDKFNLDAIRQLHIDLGLEFDEESAKKVLNAFNLDNTIKKFL